MKWSEEASDWQCPCGCAMVLSKGTARRETDMAAMYGGAQSMRISLDVTPGDRAPGRARPDDTVEMACVACSAPMPVPEFIDQWATKHDVELACARCLVPEPKQTRLL